MHLSSLWYRTQRWSEFYVKVALKTPQRRTETKKDLIEKLHFSLVWTWRKKRNKAEMKARKQNTLLQNHDGKIGYSFCLSSLPLFQMRVVYLHVSSLPCSCIFTSQSLQFYKSILRGFPQVTKWSMQEWSKQSNKTILFNSKLILHAKNYTRCLGQFLTFLDKAQYHVVQDILSHN